MDTSLLRKQRINLGYYASHIFPVLVALTAGQGMLHAANLLQTYASNGTTVITSVSLTCNTASGPGASATIIVKPLAPLVSPEPDHRFGNSAQRLRHSQYPQWYWRRECGDHPSGEPDADQHGYFADLYDQSGSNTIGRL